MNNKIRFGFFFDFRNPSQWHRPRADLYAETLEFISWTESIGFGGAWIAEHHGSDDGYIPSPLVIASAIAARTKKIRIGTSLCVAPLYHPVRFAEDCAIIDILSNGRFEVALGVGYRKGELDAYGSSFTTRGNYTDEFMQIARRLWQGETVSFKSVHFNIDKALATPRPIQDHLPMEVGGFSLKAVERAAKLGDGYIGVPELYPTYVEQLRACGKNPEAAKLSILDMGFYVANDPEKAYVEIGPHSLYCNNHYAKWQPSFTHMDLATLRASGKLKILTPKEAIAYLEAQLTRTPINNFMTVPPAGYPLSKFAEHVELFAKEVIPAFS